jgi:hypothetical protein
VYAFEAADNHGFARNLILPKDAALEPGFEPTAFSTATAIRAHGEALLPGFPSPRRTEPRDLIAIPYCLWANRGKGEMVVWVPESADAADYPGVGATAESGGMHLSASHCWRSDTLLALVDGKLPRSPGDETIPRTTFWPKRGTEEWIEIDFDAPRKISSCKIFWFDDTGRGECRIPASASLSVLPGKTWQTVPSEGLTRGPVGTVTFPAVETRALKLDVRLQPGLSSGILEWQVE